MRTDCHINRIAVSPCQKPGAHGPQGAVFPLTLAMSTGTLVQSVTRDWPFSGISYFEYRPETKPLLAHRTGPTAQKASVVLCQSRVTTPKNVTKNTEQTLGGFLTVPAIRAKPGVPIVVIRFFCETVICFFECCPF